MITVELTDPGAFCARTPLGSWFVSAENPGRLKEELEKPSFLALSEKRRMERLGALADDGTLLHVPSDGSPLELYRTINATRELYFRRDEQGNWLFGDHFRNMTASVPAESRRPGENALLDFLLYVFPEGNSTLLRGIRRLVPGELRSLDFRTGEERSRQAENIPCESAELGLAEAVAALEETLRATFGEPAGNECVLFSGGVDSTLALLFRPAGTTALTIGIDTPEFAFEMEYARQTARLLGSAWSFIPLGEADYRKHFEETIVNLGQPVHPNFQAVFLNRAFQESFGVFWGADASDTLFGHPHTRQILEPENRKCHETPLAESFDSPRGYGALSNTTPDFRIVRDLFGEKAVSCRIEARFSRVLESVKIRPGSGVEEHVQMDSLVEFLTRTTSTASLKRQAAAVFGRQSREPFCSRGVLRIASAIPPGKRFLHDGEFKPVPKALLRKLLPAYPFYGRKGGSDIPRTRFCQSGPFKGFFSESALPDLLPARGRDLLLNPQWDWSYMTLSAAAFSTWQEKVLKAHRIERVPGTRVFTPGESADGKTRE
ncbi:MAG: asparagine synthase-related protein [Synergistales bacterium]